MERRREGERELIKEKDRRKDTGRPMYKKRGRQIDISVFSSPMILFSVGYFRIFKRERDRDTEKSKLTTDAERRRKR